MAMFSRKLASAAAVAAALGLPAVALAIERRASPPQATATATATATAAAKRIPTSSLTTGVPEVGALFPTASSASHDCTASVVHSLHGDVVLTAAHCVSGSGAGMVFAPAYRDKIAPYGFWTVTAAHLAPGWLKSQDPRDDFAFLTVAPRTIGGRSMTIEQVTGAYQLGASPRSGEAITVLGYPAGTDNDAITCRTTVYFTGTFPSFDCHGYVAGTSGGPWLVNSGRNATIVGVIGGMNQGGCVEYTSYASLLDQTARRVYAQAAHHTAPDVAPAPGGDGC
jgi:V8-like Glu-specific endopeptidase